MRAKANLTGCTEGSLSTGRDPWTIGHRGQVFSRAFAHGLGEPVSNLRSRSERRPNPARSGTGRSQGASQSSLLPGRTVARQTCGTFEDVCATELNVNGQESTDKKGELPHVCFPD